MKELLPKDFNLYWIKNNSLKYKIIDENYLVYEYIFNFLIFLLLIITYIFYGFFEYYLGDMPISSFAAVTLYLSLKDFCIVIVSGTTFSLNLLFCSINIKNLFIIRLLIKGCSAEEISILRLLRSYYRGLMFSNIFLCFFVIYFYISNYLL
jgi:hypothetical protein